MLKRITNFFLHLLFLFFRFILIFFSFNTASNICGKLAKSIGKFHKASKIAYKNLKNIYPEKTDEEIKVIIEKVWEHLGRNFGEFVKLNSLSKEEILNLVEHSELQNLQKYLKEHPKVIIVSGHFGNWEIAPKVANYFNIPFYLIYRHANNKYFDREINKIRLKYVKGLFDKGIQGARNLVKTLLQSENFILCMLVDQKLNTGIKSNFLGKSANTSTFAAELSCKYKMPIIMARIERINMEPKFKIKIGPYLDEHLQKPTNYSDLTQQLNDIIGTWIHESPEQWFWVHKRWS
ncbi:MAG: lysophospholipid acyltransferase family protein [Sphingobacteriia bacterium]|nr:lysophospholipid acyltransferase family protein [Sphingobacteriia bacterium]